jgi:hypothetical protein
MKVVLITNEKIIKPSIKEFKIQNFLWREFGNKDLNLRDYDGVIFDLTGIDNGASDINWSAFSKVLSFDVTKDVLLESSSFIIVIGNPFISIGTTNIAELLGVQLKLVVGKGDSINKTKYYEKSKYKDYLRNIKTYEYSFDQPEAIIKIQTIADRVNFKHTIEETPYLITRAGKIVAAQLEPIIYNTDHYGNRNAEHPVYSGELVFLPSSKIEPSESMRLLLEANKGQDSDISKPEWVSSIAVIGEDKIRSEISGNQVIIDKAVTEKEILLLQLADIRKPLDILYKADKHLEDAIKHLLKSIGANIIEPETSDKVEFYITYKELKFVVEVKSTIGASIDQKGLRQVLDWQNDAFDLTGEDYKPLVIASAQYDKPYDERNNDILPPNLVEYSTKKDIAVITVIDLYKISQDIVKGDESIDGLLNKLSTVAGLYEYTPKVNKEDLTDK